MNPEKQRVVIKVGTNSLLRDNTPSVSTFQRVAASIQALSSNHDVLLVTSGAIGIAMKEQGLSERPVDVHTLQALSMMGQVGLLRRWRQAMEPVNIGQVLVTSRELQDQSARRLLVGSLQALWKLDAVPVVNENDAITTDEITFGDNDKLAAQVAIAMGAHALVILSDQDGIMQDFGTNHQKVLPEVSISDIRKYVKGGYSSVYGKGGADSKVFAAELALGHAIPTYVTNASRERAIEEVLAGMSGTKITL